MEQAHVFRHLEEAAASRTFRTVLLHGVTGSGKTEIYLRLAQQVIARGGRVLMLVPEISLTPAVAGVLRSRFGDRVAIQHSALSDGERHDQWHLIRRGGADIVIGTRSAVFAPLEQLALVIVDEEHDGSYKQDEAPRYHGRDVAIVRARMEGALVVLGSATPSLESAWNAAAGRYDKVVLTKRVLDRPLADVQIVDMRREYAELGPDVTLSRPLLEAIAERLGKGEQTLVLLNRRGFATVIFCRQCGASLECPHCSVSLTFHRAQRRVRCHYCNYTAPVPKKCGACQGEYLEQSGFGTERLETDLKSRFPGARVVRVDRDTVRRRGAIAGVLQAVSRGDVDIVVGTQMIAKGHDFPAVTLVGVVSADVGLGLADFRAAERTFQLLTQVAGRAGRGDVPGQAIVQTLYPGHYAVRSAAAQDYTRFYEREMEFRTSLKYPPAIALINVIVKARTSEAAMADAHDLVIRTRRYHPHGHVIGPAPAALSRLKNEYRAQFFIKGKQRPAMREALLRALEERPEIKRRAIVDVDPLNVL
jgi:primosomal protein N' (replication factor Y)